ncbi:phosphatidylinositol N-acetylglucosaminyltransferase [Sporobolomyces koalae]|uniref:phosphatidylinositol N-acetylglucosaminyltransferase n=1 Tax=Sporobolomyces koalae TaxID=500713 RepID=UPI00317EDD65
MSNIASGGNDMERPPAPERPPYRKVLYLRQPYPDNWVDPSFLQDLERNLHAHAASLPPLLRQTLPVTQHLACTFIVVAVFVRLSTGTLSSTTLLSLCLVLGIIFRLWTRLATRTNEPDRTADPEVISTPLIPLFALYLLSPALKTLTRSTTSDSIWALSGTLFAINLVFADCRAIPTETCLDWKRIVPFSTRNRIVTASSETRPRRLVPRAPLPSTLSLTAALSGTTVLASRLDQNRCVFSLLLFSTLWFGPFPTLRSTLTLRPTLVLTWILVSIALVSLNSLDHGTTILSIAATTLLGSSIVAPLIRGSLIVRYKDTIRGPWDQAVPRL